MADEVITIPTETPQVETPKADPLAERMARLLEISERQQESIQRLSERREEPLHHHEPETYSDDDEDDMTPSERKLAQKVKELEERLAVPTGTAVKTQVIDLIQDSGLNEYQKSEIIKEIRAANASELAKYAPDVVANFAIAKALKIKEPEKRTTEPPAGTTSTPNASYSKGYLEFLRGLGVGKGLGDVELAKQYGDDRGLIVSYEQSTGRKAKH